MNPEVLTVYETEYNKIRLGSENDGGYIICELPIEYDVLISGGVENNIKFETDFCKRHNIKCFMFDGTINNIFIEDEYKEKMTFIKKNIGNYNNEKLTNLHDLMDKYENVFIKMDIEGHEIEWLLSLTETHMKKIKQLVIEFHYPFGNMENIVFNKINQTHVLVHLHGNNYQNCRIHKGVVIPEVFECTYLNKDFMKGELKKNKNELPTKIDMKNCVSRKEIKLNYKPFVNK